MPSVYLNQADLARRSKSTRLEMDTDHQYQLSPWENPVIVVISNTASREVNVPNPGDMVDCVLSIVAIDEGSATGTVVVKNPHGSPDWADVTLDPSGDNVAGVLLYSDGINWVKIGATN